MGLRFWKTVIVASLSLCGTACDKPSGDSSPSPAQPSAKAAPAAPSTKDEENAAVESLKVAAAEVSHRYAKPEGADPSDTQHLPLSIMVTQKQISVRRTGDLVTPFKGEVLGLATLDLPGSWFNNGQPHTEFYDVVWPFIYRDSKWQDDRVSVEAKFEAAQEPALASMAEVVRMRVCMWGLKRPAP
jgi:hypothetical protein